MSPRAAPPPDVVRRLARAPASPAEARRVIDLALDVVRELAGAREALVAVVRPDGADVRMTPGLDSPTEDDLRAAAARLSGTTGDLDLPGRSRPLLAAANETGGGGHALVAVSPGRAGRSSFDAWVPVVLLALARAALVLQDRRRAAEVLRLHGTAQRVAASLDVDEVLSEIVRDAVDLLDADSGDMLLRDPDRGVLRVVAVANFPDEMVGFEIATDEGVSPRAMASRRTIVVDDYLRYRHRVRRLDHYAFRAVLCAPLIARGEPMGALNVHATDPRRRFTQDDARLLSAFANHAAIAIDNARRYQNEVRLAQDLARANAELERSLTLQQRLVNQVLLDRGPGGVAQELADLLARPVVLQDHLLRVIAGAAPQGSAGWEELALPRDAGGRPKLRRFLERLHASGRAAAAPAGAVDGPARLVSPIRIGRETSGYLILPAEGRLASLDRALIEVASTGVALELAKLRAQVEMEYRLRGDVVTDLVTGAYASPDSISARAAQLGYDLSEPRDLIVLRIDDFEAVARRVGETGGLDVKRRLFDTTQAAVSARSPASMVAAQGEAAIVLAAQTAAERGGYGEREPLLIADELREVLRLHLPDLTVSASTGDRCSAPGDYAESFRVAQGALDAMAKLGRRDRTVDARRLGVYRLLITAADPGELRRFAERVLGPLLVADDHRRELLLETLRAYVDSGFNQRETARRSFVHFNTVAYRLRRIEELLGLDLNDPQALLDVTFALRVGDLVGLF